MDIEFRNSMIVGVSALEAITRVLVKHAVTTHPGMKEEVLAELHAGTPNGDDPTRYAVTARIEQYFAGL